MRAGNGKPGEAGRLAIYSKTTPVTLGASLSGSRFDNAATAYPAALLEEAPPVMHSITMEKVNQSGGYIATLSAEGTPGVRYNLERSTDLKSWTQDGSPRTASVNGRMSITRTANPGAQPSLYWRLRKL